MTIHTLPPRPAFRLVKRKGAAEVVPMPRKTVGEAAAEAVDQIDKETQERDREREAIKHLTQLRWELGGLASRALFIARFHGLHGPVDSLFRGIVNRLSEELKVR